MQAQERRRTRGALRPFLLLFPLFLAVLQHASLTEQRTVQLQLKADPAPTSARRLHPRRTQLPHRLERLVLLAPSRPLPPPRPLARLLVALTPRRRRRPRPRTPRRPPRRRPGHGRAVLRRAAGDARAACGAAGRLAHGPHAAGFHGAVLCRVCSHHVQRVSGRGMQRVGRSRASHGPLFARSLSSRAEPRSRAKKAR